MTKLREQPDLISNKELKAYLLYLHLQEKRATSTCNVVAAALRFLYHRTLGRPHTDFDVPMARQPKKLPSVLSRDEVARPPTRPACVSAKSFGSGPPTSTRVAC